MRKYGKFEKEQIIKINQVELGNSNLLDFLTSSILNERALLLNATAKSLIFIHKKTDNLALNEFFEFIGLVEYLKNNHLIFVHKNSTIPIVSGFVTSNLDANIYNQNTNQYNTIPIPTDIYDLVQGYKQTFLISGTELKGLEISKFKTQEELQFEKEISIAKVSLLLAFIALIFSFLSPFIFDTKIDESQINDLKYSITKFK